MVGPVRQQAGVPTYILTTRYSMALEEIALNGFRRVPHMTTRFFRHYDSQTFEILHIIHPTSIAVSSSDGPSLRIDSKYS